jgi:CheY-like chemotaxis protein
MLNNCKKFVTVKIHQYDFSNIIVLIAEDDIFNQLYLTEILRSTNATIIMAGNGKEALELIEVNPQINIALFDIKMPVMDGLTLARSVKEKYFGLPMIAQTAHILPHDKKIALQAGFSELITKPIDRENLLRLIASYTCEK